MMHLADRNVCSTLFGQARLGISPCVGVAVKTSGGAGHRGVIVQVLGQFSADNPHIRWRFDSERHTVASDSADNHGDVFPDDELLSDLTTEHEHGSVPP
jgi:hypothetical protein